MSTTSSPKSLSNSIVTDADETKANDVSKVVVHPSSKQVIGFVRVLEASGVGTDVGRAVGSKVDESTVALTRRTWSSQVPQPRNARTVTVTADVTSYRVRHEYMEQLRKSQNLRKTPFRDNSAIAQFSCPPPPTSTLRNARVVVRLNVTSTAQPSE